MLSIGLAQCSATRSRHDASAQDFDALSLKGVLHVGILWMHFLPANGFKNNTRHGGRIEGLALLDRVIEVAQRPVTR